MTVNEDDGDGCSFAGPETRKSHLITGRSSQTYCSFLIQDNNYPE
jgi:hypothetical protein